MHKELKVASYLNIFINIFLFIINLSTGFIFSSLSLISKAFESVHDILTGILIYFSIKINNLEADEKHPFGHTRAENIAGYTIGIFMLLLAFSIIKEAIFDLFYLEEIVIYSNILIYVAIIGFITKLGMYLYIKNILTRHKSASLKANMQDHLNDVMMYIGILIAVIAIKYGFFFVDSIVGLLIGIIILKSGSVIVIENINFLMGATASKKLINHVKKTASEFVDVLGINTIKTQYLGSKVQVEIHIELDSKLNLKESHNIGKEVKYKIERIEDVGDCFVHIDVYSEQD